MNRSHLSAHTHRSNPSAFTLIELLVVVAIITMLIAISLPSLSRAKARAMTVTCGTRLHSLGMAMHEYLAENDDIFPVNGIIMPKSGVPTIYAGIPKFASTEVTNPDKWRIEFGALYSYMGGTAPDSTTPLPLPPTPAIIAKSYLCPVDTDLDRTYNTSLTPGFGALTLQTSTGGNPRVVVGPGAPGYWSYSVNATLNSLGRMRNNFPNGLPWSDPMKMVSIKRESDFLVFIEEDNASLFNDEVFDAPAYNGGDFLTDRHEGSGNVVHADNSVELFNAVQFNQVPQAVGSSSPNATAMLSPITRDFFPDGGEFAAGQ